MTSRDDQLLDLFGALCNGALTADEEQRLAGCLLEDSEARSRYVKYMDLHLALMDLEVLGDEADPQYIEEQAFPSLPSLSAVPSLPPSPSSLSPSFVGGPVFSYMVATVVLCLMLLGAWAYKISHDRDLHVVSNSRRSTTSGQPELAFIGQITGMKDCRWSDPGTQTVVGALVRLDREYALSSGLLEITYKTGAKVILEGPCTYKIESTAGGFLERGKLTARIIHQGPVASAAGAKPPAVFFVQTPTAVVTDLGTEFGVEVKTGGETQVHVFQGTVEAEWYVSSGATGRKVKLTTGQAAGFDRRQTSIVSVPIRPQEFTCVIPTATGPLRNVALKKTIIKWSGVYRYGDPTKGTSDWTTWDRFGVWHVNDGITDESEQGIAYWKGRERTPNEYFVIYLAGIYDIQRIELVNTHNSTGNDRGTKDFEIWAADEIDQYKELVSPRLVLKGTLPCRFGAGADIPCDVFSAEGGDFERFNARYVKFVAKTFYEGEDFGGCGLNEIRLFAVPATDAN